jgi:GxxExxY protein
MNNVATDSLIYSTLKSEDEFYTLEEAKEKYQTNDNFPLKNESFEIIGICMEVHRILGRGFSEIVYKDAIELELKLKNIPYEREKKYLVEYKGKILPHHYYADFVINNIIVEIKAQNGVVEEHFNQVINYLAISKLPIGLLINFGENSLKFKRIIF